MVWLIRLVSAHSPRSRERASQSQQFGPNFTHTIAYPRLICRFYGVTIQTLWSNRKNEPTDARSVLLDSRSAQVPRLAGDATNYTNRRGVAPNCRNVCYRGRNPRQITGWAKTGSTDTLPPSSTTWSASCTPTSESCNLVAAVRLSLKCRCHNLIIRSLL